MINLFKPQYRVVEYVRGCSKGQCQVQMRWWSTAFSWERIDGQHSFNSLEAAKERIQFLKEPLTKVVHKE